MVWIERDSTASGWIVIRDKVRSPKCKNRHPAVHFSRWYADTPSTRNQPHVHLSRSFWPSARTRIWPALSRVSVTVARFEVDQPSITKDSAPSNSRRIATAFALPFLQRVGGLAGKSRSNTDSVIVGPSRSIVIDVISSSSSDGAPSNRLVMASGFSNRFGQVIIVLSYLIMVPVRIVGPRSWHRPVTGVICWGRVARVVIRERFMDLSAGHGERIPPL